jgi:tetratricopeptide (TPR) repeat protein
MRLQPSSPFSPATNGSLWGFRLAGRFALVVCAVAIGFAANDQICELPQTSKKDQPTSSRLWVRKDGAKLLKDDGTVSLLARGDIVTQVGERGESLLVVRTAWGDKEEGLISRKDAFGAQAALACFTRTIEANPADARAFLGRASVQRYAFGEFPGYNHILGDLDNAISLDPKLAMAYMERGLLKERQRKMKATIADYSKTIQLKPCAWLPFFSRGRCRVCLGEHAKAVADFDHALELKPAQPQVAQERAKALLQLGHYRKALRALQQLRRTNDTADLDGLVIEALLGLARYEEVATRASLAIRRMPADATAYSYRPLPRAAQRDFRGAAIDHRQAMKRGLQNVLVCSNYAWFLATCPDGAFRDGAKAVELAKHACFAAVVQFQEDYNLAAATAAESDDFSIRWVREGWRNWRSLAWIPTGALSA